MEAWRSFLLLFVVALANGQERCGLLTGVWKNQLGSKVHFHQSATGELSGLYLTAVQSRPGAAGNGNQVYGVIDPSDGLLTFSVNWMGKTSATTWVGQCMRCGNKEVIQTTWLLRRRQNVCGQLWNSTWSNQDTFYRDVNTILRNVSRPSNQPPANELPTGCHLSGTWYNEQGGQLMLQMESWNNIQGSISKKLTSQPGGGISITGRWDSNDTSSNFGLHALNADTPHGRAVIGYVGQCYQCQDSVYLDTMWLMRTPSTLCRDSWSHFHIGRSKFTTSPPTEEGNI